MFGPTFNTSSLSLSKVLGGISKFLGIANQAIPIYKELKPIMTNAKKVMSVLKEFKDVPNNKTNNVPKLNKPIKEEVSSTPSPVFFQ